ncbi:MAG: glutamate-5-semialdehyde dehydrogenase [Oscillospiraceae bacterium]|nr:glutamate-5-semialdehyde dehydrogenase [Oscillospiraceae bacterium]
MTTQALLTAAKAAKASIAFAGTDEKNALLCAIADSLLENTKEILQANEQDVQAAKGTISDVMIDRLQLTKQRIAGMAEGVRAVANLQDPIGQVEATVHRPNGLSIEKTRVPLGVVAIIYESRPNVTADAAALCLKSGNVCVLRGGKEAIHSNMAIAAAMRKAAAQQGFDENIISFVQDTTRESANQIMAARGYIDLLIPRGGGGLIKACVENAKVPCIETGTGICHIYIDAKADVEMAVEILKNAKTSRPSVCNAAEVCLVHKDIADRFLPLAKKALDEKNVELRLCSKAQKIIKGTPATEQDFDTEFLDYILAVKVVDSTDEAVAHIACHSTGHSECIVTRDALQAEKFTCMVDSAAVYVNASTRFTDGGEFGLGCEMGISTQKVGARGPMGLFEITTYKYIVRGCGQVR